MLRSLRLPLVLLVAVGVFGAAACSDEDKEYASNFALRNEVAVLGTKIFEDHGEDVKRLLECRAATDVKRGDFKSGGVVCSGVSKRGHKLALVGHTDEIAGDLSGGEWVATVDGKEIYRDDCLTCAARKRR